MRCPFCAEDDSQVKDSRPCEEGMSIRRRRYCVKCGSRFTTFERVQLRELTVIKKNGARVAFDRDKLVKSFKMAVRKRSIPDEKVDMLINHIIRTLEMTGESEINSATIGEMIMSELEKLDQVAYVRFASVYKEFGEVKDFGTFIKKLKKS